MFTGYYGITTNANRRTGFTNLVQLASNLTNLSSLLTTTPTLLNAMNTVLSSASSFSPSNTENTNSFNTYDWGRNQKTHAIDFNRHYLKNDGSYFGLHSEIFIKPGVDTSVNARKALHNAFHIPIYFRNNLVHTFEYRETMRLDTR